MDKVKSTRKPKAKIIKEENTNSNIDIVIFENTEKEIEDDINTINDTNKNINTTNDGRCVRFYIIGKTFLGK